MVLFLGISVVGSARAQVPDVPKRCTQQESQQPAQEHDTPYQKGIVDRIDFDGPIHLSDADVAQVIDNANQAEFHAEDRAWIDQLREVWLRETWLNQGYFHALVEVAVRSLGQNSSEEHFVVSAHIDEGRQYYLGEIRFEGVTEFAEAELRGAFQIRDGEIFSVAKVRQGIEALTRLYDSRGYIDFTAAPDTEVDENLQRIDLVIHLDQQPQFRVGKVDIAGLNPTLEAGVRSIVSPGEIFNPYPVAEFLTDHKELLLALTGLYPTDGYNVKRNFKAGIADLTFDFRGCDSRAQSNSATVAQ